jgi:glycogen phosphorylase
MLKTTHTLRVFPRLPAEIARLADLASNFLFSWSPDIQQLMNRLDPVLWRKTDANPRLFIRCVDQGILERAAEDEGFVSACRKVLTEFDAYLEQPPLAYRPAELGVNDTIAYFCAEYGFHECFPIYSGGLGVLAGDHCKTASDMRLPFVAVGLLYRQGYFRQQIDRYGSQVPSYPYIEPEHTPLAIALDADGAELRVEIPFPDRSVHAKVWRAGVGRVPILLLDTDIDGNSDADRQITRVLYGGDRLHRLQQEAVLGIGGVRALRALGFDPAVWHINEGHAAFIVLERVRELVRSGLSFDVALEASRASTVFTTHTPVAAGHDIFPCEAVAKHLPFYIAELGVSEEALLELGRMPGNGDDFNMTRLGIRGAAAVNGVSRIHGRVSAELCADSWPEVPPTENPVGFVTNGVHVPTFMRQAWVELLTRYVGPSWRSQLMDRTLVERIMEIPDEWFWYTNQRVKSQMLEVLRTLLGRQHTRNSLSEAHIHRLLRCIDPEDPNVLTIGFARRFATYKRSTLILTDLEWLEALVAKEDRPVLFIFAGKAHPADEPAQHMMRELQRISTLPPFIGRILLLEGYDLGISRLLTSGVDVWLNTPVHPFEASGTSGMKAAINSTVNLSVLDGWWAEAYDGRNGWGIPPSVDDQGASERDRQDAVTLYEILQDEVVPLYYARDDKLGYSPGWVEVCKRSMASVLPHFNSERVMHDYARSFYGPAARHGRKLAENGHTIARELAAWKKRMHARWPGVKMSAVAAGDLEIAFDERAVLEVDVELNGLEPQDVRVECVVRKTLSSELTVPLKGYYSDSRRPANGLTYVGDEIVLLAAFEPQVPRADGTCRYRLALEAPWAGELKYEIRAVPQHPHLLHPHELGLMRWL